jgi:hypothetical protein
LKPSEILAELRTKEPKLLDGLPEKKAEQLLKAALSHIRESIAAIDKGDLAVGMLGRFKVTEHTKGEGAEAVVVRKVTYIAPKPADKEARPEAAAAAAPEQAPAKAAKAKA